MVIQMEETMEKVPSRQKRIIILKQNADGSCSAVYTTGKRISSTKLFPRSVLWGYSPTRASAGVERYMDQRCPRSESSGRNVRYYWAPIKYDPNKSPLLQKNHICKVLPNESPPVMGTLFTDYKPQPGQLIRRCPQPSFDPRGHVRSPRYRTPSPERQYSSGSFARKYDQRYSDPRYYFPQNQPYRAPKAFSPGRYNNQQNMRSPRRVPSSASLRRRYSPYLARRPGQHILDPRYYRENLPYQAQRRCSPDSPGRFYDPKNAMPYRSPQPRQRTSGNPWNYM